MTSAVDEVGETLGRLIDAPAPRFMVPNPPIFKLTFTPERVMDVLTARLRVPVPLAVSTLLPVVFAVLGLIVSPALAPLTLMF